MVDRSHDRFLQLAREYCEWIERVDCLTCGVAVHHLRRSLPLLYASALDLQLPVNVKCEHQPGISHERWKEVYDRVGSVLGPYDLYWEVFDPTQTSPDEPVAMGLSDDLADIWRDLREGMQFCESDETVVTEEAVWSWRFNFDCHWSQHLVNAMRAINVLCTTGPLNNEQGGS